MPSTIQPRINRIIAASMLAVGILLLVAASFYASSIAAIIGLALAFWGAILLYITPSRHVPLEIVAPVAASTLMNIEKLLTKLNLNGKGIYLPPKYLKDFESSLVFVPQRTTQQAPKLEEIHEDKLYSDNSNAAYLTPPGLGLSKLFEKHLGTSFTKTDLNFIREKLSRLLVEGLEIAENAEVNVQGNTVIIELTNHIFNELCEKTRELPKTHEQLGCPLSSAFACALAKATGKPVTIEKEENTKETGNTKISYTLLEG